MTITINSKDYEVPFDLSDITLGRYVEWYEKFGRKLDKDLQEIRDRNYKTMLAEKGFDNITTDDIELYRDIDLDNHLDNEALSWFSFWTAFDFTAAKDLPEIAILLYQYRVFRHIMEESMKKSYNFPLDIDWNGEVWKVQDFQLSPQSDMSFNEVITSKEVMRQVYAIGKGKWDAMPYLCCIFFRKKNEPFTDELIAEGGDRMKLLMSLPMTHVMQVAFFLTVCVAIWKNTLVSSESQEVDTASLNL